MTIDIPEKLDEVEEWKGGGLLPLGWNRVKITSVETGESSGGHPEIRLQYESARGSIKDWVVVTEQTLGKVKALYLASGAELPKTKKLDPENELEVGARLGVFVSESPNRNDPSKMRRTVDAYKPYDETEEFMGGVPGDTSGLGGNGSTGDESDIPF